MLLKPTILVHPLDGGELLSDRKQVVHKVGSTPRWRGPVYSAV